MGNEIALSDIRQRLTDQIKSQFAELIPQDQWEGLIEMHTTEFMKVDFPKIVKECLTEKLRSIIKEEFSEPRWQNHWNGYYDAPGEAVRKIVRENSDVIVES